MWIGFTGGLRGHYRELPPSAAQLQQAEQQSKPTRATEQCGVKQTRFAEPAAPVSRSIDADDRPVRSKGCFGCFG